MTDNTKQLINQLIVALADDPQASSEIEIYGDWLGHMTDHLDDYTDD